MKPIITVLNLLAVVQVIKSEDSLFLQTEESLKQVLDSLDSGLDFMESEYKKVNLDAAIGTRLVEGQLEVLLRRLKDPNGLHLSQDYVRRIGEVRDKARQVSNMAEQYIKTGQPLYYHRIGTIIHEGFWQLDYPLRDIDRTKMIKPQTNKEVMHESDSDDCLTELFGTGIDTTQQCRMSRYCWKLMTSPGYRFYSLTHEVFYLQIGEIFGCFGSHFRPILDHLNAGFCANMLSEAEEIAGAGFPNDLRDLFMEQAALCGSLGYQQFFRGKWLQQILSWQRQPRGCWGQPSPNTLKQGSRAERDSGSRVKREERVFTDGCECHRTAVALGALGQYVRYIVEYLQQIPH